MGDVKHTPGPWFAVNDGTRDEPMMSVKAARIAGQTPRHCVAIVATGDSPQEMEDANARLIAAAPDLRSAAIEAIALLDVAIAGTVFTKPDAGRVIVNVAKAQAVLDGLRAAISKATGEAK